jgi:hypothetical protein
MSSPDAKARSGYGRSKGPMYWAKMESEQFTALSRSVGRDILVVRYGNAMRTAVPYCMCLDSLI